MTCAVFRSPCLQHRNPVPPIQPAMIRYLASTCKSNQTRLVLPARAELSACGADSLVEVNVTDGQAITIALSRGIGNATVLPFSVATVQPNYTVAGAEDDLVLLQTDPTGIVDWCFHWTTDHRR